MIEALRPVSRMSVVARLLLAFTVLWQTPAAWAAAVVSVDTASHVQISSVCFSRTEFDYTYTAQAVNSVTPPAIAAFPRHQQLLTHHRPRWVVNLPHYRPGRQGDGSTPSASARIERSCSTQSSLHWQVQCAAPTNNAPVANAGADQTVFTAATVTLNGSGSSDADGNSLTFRGHLPPDRRAARPLLATRPPSCRPSWPTRTVSTASA